MKINVLNILICLLFCCTSCTKSFCVKVDGSYEGKTGGVEYCYSPSDSSLVNMPVFTSSSGIKSVLLNEQELENISNLNAVSKDSLSQKNMAKFLLEKLYQRK